MLFHSLNVDDASGHLSSFLGTRASRGRSWRITPLHCFQTLSCYEAVSTQDQMITHSCSNQSSWSTNTTSMPLRFKQSYVALSIVYLNQTQKTSLKIFVISWSKSNIGKTKDPLSRYLNNTFSSGLIAESREKRKIKHKNSVFQLEVCPSKIFIRLKVKTLHYYYSSQTQTGWQAQQNSVFLHFPSFSQLPNKNKQDQTVQLLPNYPKFTQCEPQTRHQ